jgi:hypothetical protein
MLQNCYIYENLCLFSAAIYHMIIQFTAKTCFKNKNAFLNTAESFNNQKISKITTLLFLDVVLSALVNYPAITTIVKHLKYNPQIVYY